MNKAQMMKYEVEYTEEKVANHRREIEMDVTVP